MRWIRGHIELRKAGAIGEFTTYPCRTQASSLEDAIEFLIEDAHMFGFEPRAIFGLYATTKLNYDKTQNPWDGMEEQ